MRIPTLLLALVLTASGCGDSTTTEESIGSAPEGTRWVGMNGVVVAVPDWWTTGETRCNTPLKDTVYFDDAATVDCQDPVPESAARQVSALAILHGTSGYGEFKTRDMDEVAEVDGHEVMALGSCERWFPGVCRRLFAVPDEGVVFAVTIADPGDGDYEAIRDSVRVLPDSQTTVPVQAGDWGTPSWGDEPGMVERFARSVHEAGLRAEVVEEEIPEDSQGMVADMPRGSFLASDPEPGSVIDSGGTVRITVMPAAQS